VRRLLVARDVFEIAGGGHLGTAGYGCLIPAAGAGALLARLAATLPGLNGALISNRPRTHRLPALRAGTAVIDA
jgi:hypothetical protein